MDDLERRIQRLENLVLRLPGQVLSAFDQSNRAAQLFTAGTITWDDGAPTGPAPGTIGGTVYDEYGAPLAGVTLTLSITGGGTYGTTTTNASGYGEFTGVPAATYSLAPTKTGRTARTAGSLILTGSNSFVGTVRMPVTTAQYSLTSPGFSGSLTMKFGVAHAFNPSGNTVNSTTAKTVINPLCHGVNPRSNFVESQLPNFFPWIFAPTGFVNVGLWYYIGGPDASNTGSGSANLANPDYTQSVLSPFTLAAPAGNPMWCDVDQTFTLTTL